MMLSIRELSVSYPGSDVVVVDGISLDVPSGGTLGLVGESGSGKSTVARAVVGMVRPRSGTIEVDGVEVGAGSSAAMKHLRSTTQMVFQDPAASLHPRMTVGAALVEAASVRADVAHGQGDLAMEVHRLMDLVGLPETFVDRYAFELSGGQRQRVAIARALAPRPRLLILDEVTAALDVSIQATILNLLKELQAELHLTYLAISHDLAVMRYLCDSIAVMELGSIKEIGAADEVFGSPGHPYTVALLDAVPQFGRTRDDRTVLTGEPADPADRPSGCSFRARCPVGPVFDASRDRCVTTTPELAVVDHSGPDHAVACHFRLNTNDRDV